MDNDRGGDGKITLLKPVSRKRPIVNREPKATLKKSSGCQGNDRIFSAKLSRKQT
jgi:hypothetical protein